MEVFSGTGSVKISVACLHNTLILLKMVIEKKDTCMQYCALSSYKKCVSETEHPKPVLPS